MPAFNVLTVQAREQKEGIGDDTTKLRGLWSLVTWSQGPLRWKPAGVTETQIDLHREETAPQESITGWNYI